MFPGDFDGIVAGAAAADFDYLTAWSGVFYTITGTPGTSTFVTGDQWTAIHNEILRQCDALDGFTDGIIEDPDLCNFTPDSLSCSATPGQTSCLTCTQVETIRRVLSPLTEHAGNVLFPAMQPGAELDDSGYYYSGSPNQISQVCKSSRLSLLITSFLIQIRSNSAVGLVSIRYLQ
jgi:feruloyl esterase